LLSLLFVALSVTSLNSVNAVAQTVSCAPLVTAKVARAPYRALNLLLTPRLASLKTKLDAVADQATYAPLLAEANAAAASTANGRVVVTLPDGTVVVDTSKGAANTYANFVAKTINENHNSRVAILDAQLFECGIGVETKRSATTGAVEVYVARRLGAYLDSSGTARISKRQ
jgi:hypothetical protein